MESGHGLSRQDIASNRLGSVGIDMTPDRLSDDPVATERITLLQPTSFQDWSRGAERFSQLESGDCQGHFLALARQAVVRCARPLFPDRPLESKLFFPREHEARIQYDFPLADIRLDVIPRAQVIGDKFIVTSRDQKVFSESYWSEKNLHDSRHFQHHRLQVQIDGASVPVSVVLYRDRGVARPIAGSAMLIGNPWCNNYYHWLTNCLPRVWFREQFSELARVPLLVPAHLSAFQADSLSALGVTPEERLLFDGSVWSVERLFFPSNGDFSPRQLAWIRDRLLRHFQIADSSPSRLLYISRGDAVERHVANEPEIASYLESRGFEILRLAGMPLRDQVQAFAQARLIVGPHGAGLTNIIFGAPGQTLLELHPADEVNQAFWVLANAVQHRYAFLAGKLTNAQRHFVVPLDELKRMLDRLL